ncbi:MULTISPECIES: MMPL family transporter [Paenibacillus]|uniref:MMPL family transporter n=1 Tax=Paenibacillus TaxID=44249 RepID=UPI0022B8D67A|nr:MMPL family transporter [Paenibacillus caseinilyticus]MCZ8520489.1 MMPL family transporter [Paenibacillus caseinilyticus]
MGSTRLARLSCRYPRCFILLWLIFLTGFGPLADHLPSVLQDHGLVADDAYIRVQSLIGSEFGIPADPILLVFEKEPQVSPGELHSFIRLALSRLDGLQGLERRIPPWEGEGMMTADAAYAVLAFGQAPYRMEPVLRELRERLPAREGLSVRITGKSVVQADVNAASRRDLFLAELIGLPAAFLILRLAFGGSIPALLPVLIGAAAVTGSAGILSLTGGRLGLSSFVPNVMTMTGLALSIDFALMLVSRFREELARHTAEEALAVALRTAGRAVVFSGACIGPGLAGLLFIPLPMFRSIALAALIVLAVSVLLTLTLLPALLFLLRGVIGTPRPRRTRASLWERWPRYVMRRPLRVALLAAAVLLPAVLPLRDMSWDVPGASSLPRSYESRLAEAALRQQFGTSLTPVYWVLEGKGGGLSRSDWLEAYALVERLENDPHIASVSSAFSRMKMPPAALYDLLQRSGLPPAAEKALGSYIAGNRMLVAATLKMQADDPAAAPLLRRWEAEGASAKLPFLVGGEAKYRQEVFDAIRRGLPPAALFILTANVLVLFLAFRSLLLPLKAVGMNLLSLAASFGILVWIFGEGGFSGELSPIAVMIPVFIFGLVFGISMDYGVFLLSRIAETYRETGDNERAVREGLASTSRVITAAAAILIAVTAPFAFGDVAGVRQLGVGIAAAIFIDATVIRLMLVPALMKLLGGLNWWPGHRGPR